MNRMKHLLCVLLVAALGSFTFKANAYTERNMLQKAADESTLKNVLVMKQAWVDRKSTRLNSSHMPKSRMPSSA